MTFLFLLFLSIAPLYASEIFREILQNGQNQIEFFWSRPAGPGIFPILIYLHGDQTSLRPGGRYYVDDGTLEEGTRYGYVTVSISQPGFGATTGPADFGGRATQESIIKVITHLKEKPFVNRYRIGIHGIGRGASIASMVASQDQGLRALVLESGIYDFEDAITQFELRAPTNPSIAEMLTMMNSEMGEDSWRFYHRSALLHVDNIKTPSLILNGAEDDRSFPYQSTELEHLLKANKIEAKTVIFSEVGHQIPGPLKDPHIIPFLKRMLKD